jgi:tetratricopeptide (TPR) repeat protein
MQADFLDIPTIRNNPSVMSSKLQLMALIQGARWAEAREAGRELCQLNGNDAEAWFLLGAIHGQLGDWAEAERCGEKAAMLTPGVSAAHFNLGVARLRQRKPGAAASFRMTLMLQPDHPAARDLLKEACFTEGLLLSEGANPDGAIAFLTYVLPDADSAKIRMLLGELCSRTNRRPDAVTHYRRACELDPGNAVAHVCLADAIMLGDPGLSAWDEVIVHLQTAVRLDPDNPAAHAKLATALDMRGRYGEAIDAYTKTLELSPGHPAAIWGLVRTYEGMGQPDKAEAALRPWLNRAATTPAIALAWGIMAPHLGETKAAIAALRSAMTSPTMTREIESTICFKLGDLLDKENAYNEAFDYYQRGNMLRPVPYQHASQAKRFDALIDFFSKERIARLPRATNHSELPVFIVGMPRSGTTLVESILAIHPQVHGAGELEDVLAMRQELHAASGDGRAYPDCLENIGAATLDQLAAKHLARLESLAPGAARVTDKMPQNFLNLGLIDLLFPNARVIHCARNPVDTCLSIYFQPFMQHHDYATDLGHIGNYFREYLRLMAHWRGVLRIPLLDLRYEDLVENQEEKVRHLLDFCGLPWDERCLRHHESGRIARTFSYDQVRQPIYKTSIARWKRYEKHLRPLIEALGDACDPP